MAFTPEGLIRSQRIHFADKANALDRAIERALIEGGEDIVSFGGAFDFATHIRDRAVGLRRAATCVNRTPCVHEATKSGGS